MTSDRYVADIPEMGELDSGRCEVHFLSRTGLVNRRPRIAHQQCLHTPGRRVAKSVPHD